MKFTKKLGKLWELSKKANMTSKGQGGPFGVIIGLVAAVIGFVVLIVATGMGASILNSMNQSTNAALPSSVIMNGSNGLATLASNFGNLGLAIIFIGIIGLLVGVIAIFGKR